MNRPTLDLPARLRNGRSMRRLGLVTLTALALTVPAFGATADAAPSGPPGQTAAKAFAGNWKQSVLDPDQNFRGLAAVSRSQAWVSGESLTGGKAKVFRTTDSGKTWNDVTPPGTEGLSFRDVEVNGKVAHVLAIGPGQDSRIYRSTDGGATWAETFRNTDEAAFYDCMAFYPGGQRGLAVSDPVDGKLRILATTDAGRSWKVLPNEGMPASDNEYGFAASGDCLTTVGNTAFLITGGSKSRALRSDDGGLTWTASDNGIPAGESAGGFAGDFADQRHGIAVGGDFADPTDVQDTASYTTDGRTWTGGISLTHVGEDVSFLGGPWTAVATGDYRGSTGTSLTTDGGRTWTRVSDQGYHAIECLPGGVCWAAGSKGAVARG